MPIKKKRNLWSNEETKTLKEFGEKITLKELVKKFSNRSKSSISRKKQSIFKRPIKKRVNPWTEKEEEILKKIAPDLTLSELSKKFTNKSFDRVRDKRLSLLGDINEYHGKWTKEEELLLTNNSNLKLAKLEKIFPQKLRIHIQRKRFHMTGKTIGTGIWSESELTILNDNRKLNNNELSKLIKEKTEKQIQQKRSIEKLPRKDFWSEENLEELKELSNKYTLQEIYNKIPSRSSSSIRTKYYDLKLTKPLNEWPKEYKKYYFKELNKNKELESYSFAYGKTSLTWKCIKPNCKKTFPRTISSVYTSYNNNFNFSCPYCSGQKFQFKNSLKAKYPNISKYFDEKKNKINSSKVDFASTKRFWWKCNNKKNHSYKKSVLSFTHKYLSKEERDRFNRTHLPRDKDEYNCLECEKPNLIIEDRRFNKSIHPTLNDYEKIKLLSIKSTRKKVFWQCSVNPSHYWEQTPYNILRNLLKNPNYEISNSCHFCLNIIVDKNSLTLKRPDILNLIDKNIHHDRDFSNIYFKTTEIFNFVCSKHKHHKWKNSLRDIEKMRGEPCHHCRKDYRKPENIKILLESIREDLPFLTEQQKWVFFMQSGLLDFKGKLFNLSKAIITNRFPLKEIDKYLDNEPSLVDEFIEDKNITSEDIPDLVENAFLDDVRAVQEGESSNLIYNDDEEKKLDNPLPQLKSKDFLKAIDNTIKKIHSDEEAIQFLLVSGRHKLWDDVFLRGKIAINEIKNFKGGKYIQTIQEEFLEEYFNAKNLIIPKGYNFRIKGKIQEPNLMQRLIASRLVKEKRIGNFSGTGAGKTLSAILGSRIIKSRLTIITCPNSVVDNWKKNILDIYPDSIVATKEINKEILNSYSNRFLIFNYEYFQQEDSNNKIDQILSLQNIDMIIIDEIHYTKQRVAENISKRKENIKNLIVEAGKLNKDLRVVGMSATPVINNLFEGRTMIELISGREHDDLEVKPNIPNCMKIYQSLSICGTRWMPKYNIQFSQKEIEIDSSHYLDEIREKVSKRDLLKLEQILTKARLPIILNNLEPKTLIYTHYIEGIDKILREAIEQSGMSVGMYTGQDKTGLDNFLNGNLDVLIGTSAIGTGVDGLQHVSKKLIVNILPWTNAEFEQLKGRVFRQGQTKPVELIIPVTTMNINGEIKSWCKDKLARIDYKKSIADAAVDGIIPEEHFRSEHQVLNDLIKWIERVSDENILIVDRKPLISTLFTDDNKVLKTRLRKFGDFSKLNRIWNNLESAKLHDKLKKDNEEWVHYHELYRESRSSWALVPYNELIKRYKNRNGLVIADMGCGEAFVQKELKDNHKVYSLDHVGIHNDVISCDITHTPLENECLDVAIYCLSLMGKNINSYIKEANRVLKLDGRIHIVESAKRFKNLDNFKRQLKLFGFEFISSEDMWKFVHITAQKSDRPININANINF